MTYKVHVMGPGNARDPLATTADIWVVERDGFGKARVLCPDGTWADADEAVDYPTPTLRIPAEALEALGDAIDRMRGQPSHAKTEAAVLREWLAKEQSRVDEVFRAVGRPITFADVQAIPVK